jgi:hypothetical protein
MIIEIITPKEFKDNKPECLARGIGFWKDDIKYRKCSPKRSKHIYVKGDKEGWDLLRERMKNNKGLIHNLTLIHREIVLEAL